MKKRFLDFAINLIKRYSPDIDKTKEEKLRYGLESIYLTITKLVVILIISIFLNVFWECVIFTFFYNIIRKFAFGMHASKSSICLMFSIIFFIGLPYLASRIFIPMIAKIVVGILCIIAFISFAPADTHKRPLINKKKRTRFKIAASSIAIIYVVLVIFCNNSFLSNCIIFALLMEAILILPSTYKIFKMPYNNFLYYKKHLY